MGSPSLIISQDLYSTNLLATQFSLHLLKSNPKLNIFSLISPLCGTKISKCLIPFIDEGRLTILFGIPSAAKLIKKIIEKNEIRSIFVVLNDQNGGNDVEDRSIVSKTRYFLTSVCSLLECVRQCNVTPSIVFLFCSSESVKEECLLPQFDDFKQINPIVKCKSEESARFSSLHALCHSFAVGYKMNIKIGFINQINKLIENDIVFEEFEDFAKLKVEKNVKIQFFAVGEVNNNTETCYVSRFLLFSNINLNERQKEEAIKTLMSSNISELNKNNFIWSEMRPGYENDEQIEQEIFDKLPSHLLLYNSEVESGTLWERGGPSNLKENICANLFSPWLLKQICSEFGLYFVNFPQRNCEENQMENRENIIKFFEKKLENIINLKL
ncbi:hypothetical protein Mgra_00009205 [Meloidogyne graminicola]|uniref:Uncharacterized protein n=1 Tax=Meloidogyne graminicola TaxID=189291 RepID=A0A8S9ZDL4_9BILA|nr:hypothetical protein Mgra_00009205 [Meloidogyne graminicola]